MKKWMRRVRGAVLMGLTWAVVWAPVAVLIGTTIVDPDNSMDEMWWMIGALPGFLGGVVFSTVLATAARRRRLDELSLPRVAAWGAGAGLVVGVLPFLLGSSNVRPLWLLPVVVISSITLLSAASAAASLALARMAEKRELLGANADLAELGLAEGEAQGLTSQRASSAAALEKVARPVVRGRPNDA